MKPKPKRRRQSKETPAEGVEEKQEVAEEEEVDAASSVVNCEENPLVDLLRQEDSADEELKEYKKRRDKEKKSPEMRIEVCEKCGTRESRLLPCEKCRTVYHPACLKVDPEVSELICPRCDPAVDRTCCLCDNPGGEMLSCNLKLCSRRYHRDCLKNFHSPSLKAERSPSQFTCPAHYCHTCVSELGELHPPERKQLLRCIACPTSYHPSSIQCY